MLAHKYPHLSPFYLSIYFLYLFISLFSYFCLSIFASLNFSLFLAFDTLSLLNPLFITLCNKQSKTPGNSVGLSSGTAADPWSLTDMVQNVILAASLMASHSAAEKENFQLCKCCWSFLASFLFSLMSGWDYV